VVEVIAAVAFCFGCAVFAFYVVYTTRWVIQNAIEIGTALGFLLGLYLAAANADSFAAGAPLVVLLVLSCASIGLLLRCAFFVFGFVEERAPLTVIRDLWKPSTTCLHVVGAWQYNNVAIVRAKLADEGLRRLQRGNPRQLRILASFAFENERRAIHAERMVRKKLRPMHNRGEWFSTDLGSVLTVIGSLPGAVPLTSGKLSPMKRAKDSIAGQDATEPHITIQAARSERR
jgi:hypothetical protein